MLEKRAAIIAFLRTCIKPYDITSFSYHIEAWFTPVAITTDQKKNSLGESTAFCWTRRASIWFEFDDVHFSWSKDLPHHVICLWNTFQLCQTAMDIRPNAKECIAVCNTINNSPRPSNARPSLVISVSFFRVYGFIFFFFFPSLREGNFREVPSCRGCLSLNLR